MSFKYILFDLDGTLTDPKEGITKSVQHALRAFGIDEPDLDQLVSFIGPPLIESFCDFYDFTPEQALEGVAKYREYFCDRGIFENKVIPGNRLRRIAPPRQLNDFMQKTPLPRRHQRRRT